MPNGADTGEKQLMLITVGILAVVVIGLGTGLFLGWTRLNALQAKSRDLEKDLTQTRTRADKVEELEEDKRRLKRGEAQINELLPRENELSELFNGVAERYKRTGLAFEGVAKDEEIIPGDGGKREDFIKRIAYTYKLKGGYHQIGKFVNEVEEFMSRYLEIDEIQIDSAADGLVPGVKGEAGHEVRVRLITYRYREPEAAPPPGGAGK